MQHIENYPAWGTGSTLTHRGFGLVVASSIKVSRLIVASSKWAIEMPVRKAPNERVSSIIVHLRTTAASSHPLTVGYGVRLHVFGIPGWKDGASPTRQADWYGPIAVGAVSSSGQMPARKALPIPSTTASSVWYCAPSCQFDTQDMAYVAVVPEITSTFAGFSAKSGLKMDIDVQSATSG